VVSIGNLWQRYRDFSPTHVVSSPWLDNYSAKMTGGGEAFITFLEKELFPHIKSAYPSSGKRILIGHSMGGLAVMNILLKHTNMFDCYAAIDPSMWWDDGKLLQESKTILSGKSFEKKSLFLAVANTMEKNMDIAGIRKDTSVKTVLIRPSLILADYINANKQDKLKFEWKFYKNEHHMTVPSPAMYDALKYFLLSE
jgi:predicted alpha/beta superfamily hydrolase